MAGDDRPQLPLDAVEGVFHLLAGDAQGQGAAAVDGLAPGHDGEPGAEAPAPGVKFVRVLPEVDEDVGAHFTGPAGFDLESKRLKNRWQDTKGEKCPVAQSVLRIAGTSQNLGDRKSVV